MKAIRPTVDADIYQESVSLLHPNPFSQSGEIFFENIFLLFITYTMHTVSFDWFLSGLECILNFEFCMYAKTFDILPEI